MNVQDYISAGLLSGWISGFLSGYGGTMISPADNSGAISLRLDALSGAKHRGRVVTIHYADGVVRVRSVLGDFRVEEDGAQVPIAGHVDVATLARVLAEVYGFEKD
jgi:hypothetical protein